MDKGLRNELKYMINDIEAKSLESLLCNVMDIDPHSIKNLGYTVRSLYFDDIYNSAYYDNFYGIEPREKFRIRFYNGDTSKINLELKRKLHGKTQKSGCEISVDQCSKLISETNPTFDTSLPSLFQKLCLGMMTRQLRPVVIVQYQRIPFFYTNTDVRVTIDKFIGSSIKLNTFLDRDINVHHILPTGQGILEVKFNEFLPVEIKKILDTGRMKNISFSKYCECRRRVM